MENANVSIHAPTRGATAVPAGHVTTLLVSIHAPTRGATRSTARRPTRLQVSIHAPTRGATRIGIITDVLQSEFQSTRPHGARPTFAHVSGSNILFQSTRPHGARPKAQKALNDAESVSIHAPTRGATKTCATCRIITVFQSTRPHGARRCLRDE